MAQVASTPLSDRLTRSLSGVEGPVLITMFLEGVFCRSNLLTRRETATLPEVAELVEVRSLAVT